MTSWTLILRHCAPPPFGNFPKKHPFLKPQASLRKTSSNRMSKWKRSGSVALFRCISVYIIFCKEAICWDCSSLKLWAYCLSLSFSPCMMSNSWGSLFQEAFPHSSLTSSKNSHRQIVFIELTQTGQKRATRWDKEKISVTRTSYKI